MTESLGEKLYDLIEKIDRPYIFNNENIDFNFYPSKDNDENSGFMVFSSTSDIYPNSNEYKKYQVLNKKEKIRYRHRYYACYDLRKNNEDKKVLTFILFNPSTANPTKADPTVKNCIKLASDKNYNFVEIINLYSVRDSEVSKKCIENNSINNDFINIFIKKRKNNAYVKAWGFGKENKTFCKEQVNYIETLLSEKKEENASIKVFRLNVKEKAIENLRKKILHPAASTWSIFGGINAAELVET